MVQDFYDKVEKKFGNYQNPAGSIDEFLNGEPEEILLSLEELILQPDFDERFKGKLKEQYIDPKNPAFNLPPEKGQQLYPVILANCI